MAIYSDINGFYQPTDNPARKVYDNTAVIQAATTVLQVEKGTRFFRRDFGSQLDSLLFEPVNETTANLILMGVEAALQRDEPRVLVDRNQSAVGYSNTRQRWIARLAYRFRGLPGTVSEDVLLNAERISGRE